MGQSLFGTMRKSWRCWWWLHNSSEVPDAAEPCAQKGAGWPGRPGSVAEH